MTEKHHNKLSTAGSAFGSKISIMNIYYTRKSIPIDFLNYFENIWLLVMCHSFFIEFSYLISQIVLDSSDLIYKEEYA